MTEATKVDLGVFSGPDRLDRVASSDEQRAAADRRRFDPGDFFLARLVSVTTDENVNLGNLCDQIDFQRPYKVEEWLLKNLGSVRSAPEEGAMIAAAINKNIRGAAEVCSEADIVAANFLRIIDVYHQAYFPFRLLLKEKEFLSFSRLETRFLGEQMINAIRSSVPDSVYWQMELENKVFIEAIKMLAANKMSFEELRHRGLTLSFSPENGKETKARLLPDITEAEFSALNGLGWSLFLTENLVQRLGLNPTKNQAQLDKTQDVILITAPLFLAAAWDKAIPSDPKPGKLLEIFAAQKLGVRPERNVFSSRCVYHRQTGDEGDELMPLGSAAYAGLIPGALLGAVLVDGLTPEQGRLVFPYHAPADWLFES